MKKPYAVKVNGVWYRPNAEIPEEKAVETVENPVEIPAEAEKVVEAETEEVKQAEKKSSTKKK